MAKRGWLKDRKEAGVLLAEKLRSLMKSEGDWMVLGLLKGGFVVAKAIGKELGFRYYGLLVRKIRHPLNPEVALGAWCEGEVYWVINDKLDEKVKQKLVNKVEKEVDKIKKKYAKKLYLPNLKDKRVILCDDGAATGASVLAALKFLKKERVRSGWVALPVVPFDTYKKIEGFIDDLKINFRMVGLLVPKDEFFAVSAYYEDFGQVEWEEITNLSNK